MFGSTRGTTARPNTPTTGPVNPAAPKFTPGAVAPRSVAGAIPPQRGRANAVALPKPQTSPAPGPPIKVPAIVLKALPKPIPTPGKFKAAGQSMLQGIEKIRMSIDTKDLSNPLVVKGIEDSMAGMRKGVDGLEKSFGNFVIGVQRVNAKMINKTKFNRYMPGGRLNSKLVPIMLMNDLIQSIKNAKKVNNNRTLSKFRNNKSRAEAAAAAAAKAKANQLKAQKNQAAANAKSKLTNQLRTLSNRVQGTVAKIQQVA